LSRDNDRDGQANRPMSDVFAPEDQPLIERIGQTLEGKTERQKNPHPSGSLAHATWVCARLGGWNGYGRKPGPIVLARGHVRLQTMIEGIKRLNPVGRVPAIYAGRRSAGGQDTPGMARRERPFAASGE
jgi:hypothetical protein